MAQKREKEETELNIPQMCTAPPMIPPPPPPQQQQLPAAARLLEKPDPKVLDTSEDRTSSASSPEKQKPDLITDRSSLKRPREVNRCSGSGCRKRVGLVGFRCRCGEVFCSEHRYSDRHECSFDYKAAGREAIAKENPVVRAAKLLKV